MYQFDMEKLETKSKIISWKVCKLNQMHKNENEFGVDKGQNIWHVLNDFFYLLSLLSLLMCSRNCLLHSFT